VEWYRWRDLTKDRNFNSAGAFTDEQGNALFYDNETDNYQQDHSQLHWNEKLSTNWNTNFALHYTKGKGFYENYKEDAGFLLIGFATSYGVTTTDLVRQKWLDNDSTEPHFSANYKDAKLDFILVEAGISMKEAIFKVICDLHLKVNLETNIMTIMP
jgi:iron complex outermembrane receptor protein